MQRYSAIKNFRGSYPLKRYAGLSCLRRMC